MKIQEKQGLEASNYTSKGARSVIANRQPTAQIQTSMTTIAADAALDQLLRSARTHNAFSPRPFQIAAAGTLRPVQVGSGRVPHWFAAARRFFVEVAAGEENLVACMNPAMSTRRPAPVTAISDGHAVLRRICAAVSACADARRVSASRFNQSTASQQLAAGRLTSFSRPGPSGSTAVRCPLMPTSSLRVSSRNGAGVSTSSATSATAIDSAVSAFAAVHVRRGLPRRLSLMSMHISMRFDSARRGRRRAGSAADLRIRHDVAWEAPVEFLQCSTSASARGRHGATSGS